MNGKKAMISNLHSVALSLSSGSFLSFAKG
jgi:hypothetical protein